MNRFLPDCGDYKYNDEVDCTGEDTQTAIDQFSSLWIWIILTVVYFFGLMISWVRDVLPQFQRGEDFRRYETGESAQILRFVLEEYLITGWLLIKPKPRFSNTRRWCLIFSILYIELAAIGMFYDQDSRDDVQFDQYEAKDYVYSLSANIIGFGNYGIAYFLFAQNNNKGLKEQSKRFMLGYIYFFIVFVMSTVMTFYSAFDIFDDDDRNFTDIINSWMFTFLISVMIEQFVSENFRIITRAFIICIKKVRLQDAEVQYELTELPLPTDNRSYSFNE